MKYLMLKNEFISQPILKFRMYCAIQAFSSSSLSLVSLHNEDLATLFTFCEIQQGGFCSNKLHTCVTNPSTQKRLTPQFPDTWGTKSDYELYATINRTQCFIKQFIVHKNDRTYLSDRAWRAVLWAACWKKGQRCLFNILTFKLCAQSTL